MFARVPAAIAVGLAAAVLLASSRPAAAFGRQGPHVTLQSSIQALKATRKASVAQLPARARPQEARTFAVISQLPLLFQEAYMVTCRDYPHLDPADQQKFRDLVMTLGSVSNDQRHQVVAALTAQYNAAKPDKDKIQEMRLHEHETCFLINKALAKAAGRHP
jgi:hypothetical protein